jgi:MSHA pilin protein MshA
MKRRGFTMIELIMVIVILGILAAVGIPRYIDLSSQAKTSAAKGAIGTIRAAVSMAYAQNAAGGNAVMPATITVGMFQDGAIPTNPLSPASNAVKAGGGNDGAGGWVYYNTTGTVESNDTANTVL